MSRYLRISIVILCLLAGTPLRAQPAANAPATEDEQHAGKEADPGSANQGSANQGSAGQGSGASLAAPGSPAAAPMPWVAGVPLAQRQAANRIFQEGNVLIREGLFARAADKYREALALWDHPGFRYNLAIAQINLDQPIAAYESFLHATRHGAPPLGEDLYTQAQSFLTLLRNQLAHLEVVCDEPGAEVTLDGKPLFVGPGRRTLMALPGGHVLMASKNGRLPDSEQIVLAPGQRARFALAPEYRDRVITARRWPAWRPWAVAGVGLFLVAGGGLLDWQSSAGFSRYDGSVDAACPGAAGCTPGSVPSGLHDRRERAEEQQWIARGMYLTGGVVAATGAVLLYLNRERPVRRRERIGRREVSLLPVFAPYAAGVTIDLRF